MPFFSRLALLGSEGALNPFFAQKAFMWIKNSLILPPSYPIETSLLSMVMHYRTIILIIKRFNRPMILTLSNHVNRAFKDELQTCFILKDKEVYVSTLVNNLSSKGAVPTAYACTTSCTSYGK